MEHNILLALIVILIAYALFFRQKDSFENVAKSRNECSDIAISKSILDYQLSPLNQLKTPK
jgi:hypothetical protein